jgi:hypothetical protein
MTDPRIEIIAKDLRAQIRRKAKLAADWESASASMKDWYRHLAAQTLAGRH